MTGERVVTLFIRFGELFSNIICSAFLRLLCRWRANRKPICKENMIFGQSSSKRKSRLSIAVAQEWSNTILPKFYPSNRVIYEINNKDIRTEGETQLKLTIEALGSLGFV